MTAGRDIFMATYTSNYQLHQWVPGDNFLRTDFNTDFQKIDAALGQKAEKSAVTSLQSQVAGKADAASVPRLVTGSYTGNGATQSISLGFQPKMVIIPVDDYNTTVLLSGRTGKAGSISGSGFTVTFDSTSIYGTNRSGQSYAYFAIK